MLLDVKLFITWGPYAAFHGMAQKCHIEGSMITAVSIRLKDFFGIVPK
jgi:hypothetical protein